MDHTRNIDQKAQIWSEEQIVRGRVEGRKFPISTLNTVLCYKWGLNTCVEKFVKSAVLFPVWNFSVHVLSFGVCVYLLAY